MGLTEAVFDVSAEITDSTVVWEDAVDVEICRHCRDAASSSGDVEDCRENGEDRRDAAEATQDAATDAQDPAEDATGVRDVAEDAWDVIESVRDAVVVDCVVVVELAGEIEEPAHLPLRRNIFKVSKTLTFY